ncbi:oligosaccharide flippase family protein [Hirschia litorea]|uniref:Oligosaccharide flippase family protein n=1 Tax=Hirschia litorea TaxID=1199156 RepID=A0ABW2IP66_9PROT
MKNTADASLLAQAGKAAIWSALGKWFDAVAGLVSLFVLVRILGPDLYGLFGMALIMLAIPFGIVGGPLAECLIQRKQIAPGHEAATFITDVLLAFLLSGLLVLVTPLVAQFFGQAELNQILPVFSLVLPISALGSVPAALLQRDMRFREISLIDAGGTASASLVGIGMALSGYGVWSLVFMELTRRSFRTLSFCLIAKWKPRFDGGEKLKKAHFQDLFHFNAYSIATKILGQLDASLPGAIIGAILGTQALGIFNLVTRIFTQGSSILLAPLQAITLPLAAKSQSDPDVLRSLLSKGTRLSTAIAYPFFIGAAAVSPLMVPIFFGPEWGEAVLPMQLMMLMGVRAATASFNGGIIRGAGRPELQASIVALGLVVSVVLVVLAAPYGVSAIVGAILVRGGITWLAGAVVVRQLFGYAAISQFVIGWESLLSAGVMFAAVSVFQAHFLTDMSPILALLLSVFVGVLVHFVCLRILAPNLVGDVLKILKR